MPAKPKQTTLSASDPADIALEAALAASSAASETKKPSDASPASTGGPKVIKLGSGINGRLKPDFTLNRSPASTSSLIKIVHLTPPAQNNWAGKRAFRVEESAPLHSLSGQASALFSSG